MKKIQEKATLGTQREAVTIAKYHNGRTPADGEPDELLVVHERFYERDGTVVTDPARIEQIRQAQAQDLLEAQNGQA